MANADNQFADFGKHLTSLANLDVTKWTDEFFKILAKTNVPGINMDALVASRREDLEALATANKEAVTGILSIVEQQKKVIEDLFSTLHGDAKVSGGSTTTDSLQRNMIAKQAELTRDTLQKTVDNMHTLVKTINEVNAQIAKPIIKRVPEAIDDVKNILK